MHVHMRETGSSTSESEHSTHSFCTWLSSLSIWGTFHFSTNPLMAAWHSTLCTYYERPSEWDIWDFHTFKVPQAGSLETTIVPGIVLLSISSSQETLGLQGQGLWELDAAKHIRPQDGRSSGRLVGTHGLRAPWGTGSREGSKSLDVTQGLCLSWPPQPPCLALGSCRGAGWPMWITQGISVISELDHTQGQLNQNLWGPAQDTSSLLRISGDSIVQPQNYSPEAWR